MSPLIEIILTVVGSLPLRGHSTSPRPLVVTERRRKRLRLDWLGIGLTFGAGLAFWIWWSLRG